MKKISLLFASWVLGLALVAQTAVVPPRMEKGVSTPVNAAVADDPAIAKIIAPLSVEIKVAFGKVLVQAPKGLSKGNGGGDFPLGFFLADVMRDCAAKAVGVPVQFGFTNSGGLRRNIPVGDVRIKDIYEVLPFENELVVAEYTGAELIQIVKEGIIRKGGEPCSGIKASVTGTPDKPIVAITWSDGSAIDPAGTFRLASTDYLLDTGDGTPTLKLGRNRVTTGKPLRTLVLELCERLGKEGKAIMPPEGGRYTYSPEVYEAIKAHTFKF